MDISPRADSIAKMGCGRVAAEVYSVCGLSTLAEWEPMCSGLGVEEMVLLGSATTEGQSSKLQDAAQMGLYLGVEQRDPG